MRDKCKSCAHYFSNIRTGRAGSGICAIRRMEQAEARGFLQVKATYSCKAFFPLSVSRQITDNYKDEK